MDVSLSGTVLSGGKSDTRERAENDFYATPAEAIFALLEREHFSGSILEPACGQGHIISAVKQCFRSANIVGSDLVVRDDVFDTSCMCNKSVDFLSEAYHADEYDNVITNPPFSLAQPFIEKALVVAKTKVAIFCKIQLLEGQSRKTLFEHSPLKSVYVFSKRVSPWRNGEPLNERGLPWASTMCFSWFIWDKQFSGDPVIRWI